ncbi:MAG TPA: hypothetical protein VGJ54_00835 [Streptosporangiaceae bacterium]|jgi:hypothetical protein
MRPLGLGDELRVALRTRQACWGVMCLHLEVGAAGFSQRDRDIVAKIAHMWPRGCAGRCWPGIPWTRARRGTW